MFLRVVAVQDLGTPMPESLFSSKPMMNISDKWRHSDWHTEVKVHTKGHTGSRNDGKPNQTFWIVSSCSHVGWQPFYLIWSWALGETSVPFCWRILMNFITFPDLVQAEAAININEKSFQLRALLLWRLRLRWMGKCMCQNLFCIFLIMICHRRFWSWFNKPTAYICLLSLPPLSHLS